MRPKDGIRRGYFKEDERFCAPPFACCCHEHLSTCRCGASSGPKLQCHASWSSIERHSSHERSARDSNEYRNGFCTHGPVFRNHCGLARLHCCCKLRSSTAENRVGWQPSLIHGPMRRRIEPTARERANISSSIFLKSVLTRTREVTTPGGAVLVVPTQTSGISTRTLSDAGVQTFLERRLVIAQDRANARRTPER